MAVVNDAVGVGEIGFVVALDGRAPELLPRVDVAVDDLVDVVDEPSRSGVGGGQFVGKGVGAADLP